MRCLAIIVWKDFDYQPILSHFWIFDFKCLKTLDFELCRGHSVDQGIIIVYWDQEHIYCLIFHFKTGLCAIYLNSPFHKSNPIIVFLADT